MEDKKDCSARIDENLCNALLEKSVLTMLLFALFFSLAIGNLWEIWENTTDAILNLDS